ncbi:hypothetical protein [Sporisorium scitamineum]|uniref:Uncharacterized protein n=1 Tax=Sporisorium scitamineum TaxID=49012 RepID=A0A0F7S958_9BASI|nr:hypothetical protein [Sporisorium scitamineum]
MSSGSNRKGLLPTSQDNSSQSQPLNNPPPVQRRSSQPLPGISATASSLRSRRAGSTSTGSASSSSKQQNDQLNDVEDHDYDDEAPGDYDPGVQPSTNNRSNRTNLLRAALVPGSSQNTAGKVASTSPASALRKPAPAAPLSPPATTSNRFKGTPARATRYSLPASMWCCLPSLS